MDPLLILAIGIVFLLALILVLRLNPFLALIGPALLTSLLSPGSLVLASMTMTLVYSCVLPMI